MSQRNHPQMFIQRFEMSNKNKKINNNNHCKISVITQYLSDYLEWYIMIIYTHTYTYIFQFIYTWWMYRVSIKR